MVNIAILGFGVVGSGTAEVLTENKKLIEAKLGTSINIKYILDLREFPDSPFGHLVIHDFNTILQDEEVSIVAEMMGGAHPAYDFSKAALEAKKNVVTSNKEVVATFGVELLEIAKKNNVRYMFEASVGGGIPIIRPIQNDLASNSIKSVSGILNGTTNYILTKMASEGADFSDVLAQAQKKGYAEANPTADIEGLDTARKIVILAALSYGKLLNPSHIYVEGITKITGEDFSIASKFGYSIKLIGYSKSFGDKILAMVSPRLVRFDNPLHNINDVFNGILIDADMLGEVMFYGRGAGKLPTASSVVSDIIDIIDAKKYNSKALGWTSASDSNMADFEKYSCRRMFIFDGNKSDVVSVFEGHCTGEIKEFGNKVAFISDELSESEAKSKASACSAKLVSMLRLL